MPFYQVLDWKSHKGHLVNTDQITCVRVDDTNKEAVTCTIMFVGGGLLNLTISNPDWDLFLGGGLKPFKATNQPQSG
jgi:hypothetical protein